MQHCVELDENHNESNHLFKIDHTPWVHDFVKLYFSTFMTFINNKIFFRSTAATTPHERAVYIANERYWTSMYP